MTVSKTYGTVVIFFIVVFCLTAQENWLFKHDNTLTPEDARQISLNGKMRGGSLSFRLDKENRTFDLWRFTGISTPVGSRGIVYGTLYSEKDQNRILGFSADWWMTCYVNGKQIGTTEKTGNVKVQHSVYDHCYPVKLKKGVNHIAVYLRSGKASWTFACQLLPDFSEWPQSRQARQRLFEEVFLREENVEVTYGPYIIKNGTRQTFTGIEFSIPVSACIRYTEQGKLSAKKELWSMLDGRRARQKRHIFHLEQLHPGTTYHYEIVILNEKKAEEEVLASGTFRTFPEHGTTRHKFLAISDTQVLEGIRIDAMNGVVKYCKAHESDFFVSLGDVTSTFDHFSRAYFDTFLEVLKKNKLNLPLVLLRGNHEYRGSDTDAFSHYFGKPYFAFQYGDVFYIVLDTGEDKGLVWMPDHYTLRTDTAFFMKEQATWLDSVIESPACKNAKYRIILAHAPPFEFESPYFYQNIKQLVGKHFYGMNPSCRIDLWLCGHTHSPYRYDPVTKQMYGALPRKTNKTLRLTENDRRDIHFPVYVNDGPGNAGRMLSMTSVEIRENELEIKCMTPQEELLDHITLRKGKTAEVHNTTFRLYKK